MFYILYALSICFSIYLWIYMKKHAKGVMFNNNDITVFNIILIFLVSSIPLLNIILSIMLFILLYNMGDIKLPGEFLNKKLF